MEKIRYKHLRWDPAGEYILNATVDLRFCDSLLKRVLTDWLFLEQLMEWAISDTASIKVFSISWPKISILS